MKTRKILLAFAIVVMFVTFLPFSSSARAEGKKAAGFSLTDLQGKTLSLTSLKGKVVLLNFWATWCPICVSEMPSLNRLYEEMRSHGLKVVAISTDRSASSVRDFRDRHKLSFPILLDEDMEVTRLYHVFSLPTSFLINKKGVIVEKFFGAQDWTGEKIRKKIEKLL